MDQRDNGDPAQPHPIQASYPLQRQRPEVEVKDAVAARKVQKADREKLRRDRLNEQFLELGHSLDPDRPKNDKGTILTDTIQVLKDLTAEVNKLKAEYAAISGESRELTQEKNELKEEKASLKSEVDRLNLQYQQRLRVMFPWTAIEPSVVMTPSYPYPVPLPVPTGPIPVHPALQPFPFFGNQNPSAIANPCSTFIPYPSPGNHHIDQPSYQCASSSRISNKLDFKSKTSDCCRGSNEEKSEDSNDVVTELELKIPGSTTQQEHPAEGRKGKQPQRKEKSIVDGSSSSRHLPSPSFQESSSNSLGHPEVQ